MIVAAKIAIAAGPELRPSTLSSDAAVLEPVTSAQLAKAHAQAGTGVECRTPELSGEEHARATTDPALARGLRRGGARPGGGPRRPRLGAGPGERGLDDGRAHQRPPAAGAVHGRRHLGPLRPARRRGADPGIAAPGRLAGGTRPGRRGAAPLARAALLLRHPGPHGPRPLRVQWVASCGGSVGVSSIT